MAQIYITSDKDDSLAKNKSALCDPAFDLYFEDIKCKNFIQ